METKRRMHRIGNLSGILEIVGRHLNELVISTNESFLVWEKHNDVVIMRIVGLTLGQQNSPMLQ